MLALAVPVAPILNIEYSNDAILKQPEPLNVNGIQMLQ